MGYMRHHAILVTTFNKKLAEDAYERALIVFGGHVTPIMEAPVNDYYTFLIPPDGSKEGWADSDYGNEARAEFITYLEKFRYEDRSHPFDWVEIQYGDDDHETELTNGKGEILDDSDRLIREEGLILD